MTTPEAALERLRRREAELAEAQALAHIGSFVYDLATGWVTWSDEMYRIYGYAPGAFEPTSCTCLDATHPADRARFEAHAAEWMAAWGGPFEAERRIVRPDGEIRHVHTRGRGECDGAGGPVRLVGTAADVTDRQRSEQAIREAAARFQAIVRTAREPIVLTDPQGAISLWNPAAAALFGYADGEAIGMPFRRLLADDAPAPLARLATTCGETDEPMPPLARPGRRRDGGTFPMELASGRWTTAEGSHVSHIVRDLREREQLARLKDEFLARVSHELRIPLNTVSGALDVLLEPGEAELPTGARRMAEIARRGVGRLHGLVRDLLDLQSLSRGRVRMVRRPCDLPPLVEGAIELVQAAARARGIDVARQVPALVVDADPDRAIQVLTNLLTNAITASPAGGRVVVAARVAPEGCRIEVQDGGPGLPPGEASRIFEAFHQAAVDGAGPANGLGLGLTIARHIVEQHGGRIWLQNVPGGGVRACFTLPLAIPASTLLD